MLEDTMNFRIVSESLGRTIPLTAAAKTINDRDENWGPVITRATGRSWRIISIEMVRGTQLEVLTPGKNQKHYLAAALDPVTGKIVLVLGERKINFLFRQSLDRLDRAFKRWYRKIYVVCDNYRIHKAKAADQCLNDHPNLELVWLPFYCPKANPIERAFGDVYDKCTRSHTRKLLRTLIGDVERRLKVNGPWKYQLSEIYNSPEVQLELDAMKLQATQRHTASAPIMRAPI
jgi:transposase